MSASAMSAGFKRKHTQSKPKPSRHGIGRCQVTCTNVQKMHDAQSGRRKLLKDRRAVGTAMDAGNGATKVRIYTVLIAVQSWIGVSNEF